MPNWEFMHELGHEVCDDEHPDTQALCDNVFFALVGVNPDLLNSTMISFYLDHLPGGASVEMFVHYAQLFLNKDHFVRYYTTIIIPRCIT